MDCEGTWGDFGDCSKECGHGTRSRTFSVTTAADGGAECEATDGDVEEQECNTQVCPEMRGEDSMPWTAQVTAPWSGSSVEDLHNEYGNIFKVGNRNAASHEWATFVLQRSAQMTAARLETLFHGFCPVSGSPVYPRDSNRYRLSLPRVDGSGESSGFLHFCCSPCDCDAEDFLHVDSKTIETADGPRTYNFVVIGNPCHDEAKLLEPFVDPFSRQTTSLSVQAAEVRCEGDVLQDAFLSDAGYVIVGMLLDDATSDDQSLQATGRSDMQSFCESRAQTGYSSGMGLIFRKVAEISPVSVGSPPDATPTTTEPAPVTDAATDPPEPAPTTEVAAPVTDAATAAPEPAPTQPDPVTEAATDAPEPVEETAVQAEDSTAAAPKATLLVSLAVEDGESLAAVDTHALFEEVQNSVAASAGVDPLYVSVALHSDRGRRRASSADALVLDVTVLFVGATPMAAEALEERVATDLEEKDQEPDSVLHRMQMSIAGVGVQSTTYQHSSRHDSLDIHKEFYAATDPEEPESSAASSSSHAEGGDKGDSKTETAVAWLVCTAFLFVVGAIFYMLGLMRRVTKKSDGAMFERSSSDSEDGVYAGSRRYPQP